MTEQNPFELPQSAAGGEAIGAAPRAVDAGRGLEWLKTGWALFLKNPGIWIAIAVTWVIVFVVLNFIPVAGFLAFYFLAPVFTAGTLFGCRDLSQGGELRFDHLFAGFKHNTGNLVLVGVFYVIGIFLVGIIAVAVVGGGAVSGALLGNTGGAAAAAGAMMLAMLIVLALSVPLAMAFWFAPALVAFRGASPIDALKASFSACLKNVMPFLIYGILLLVLSVVATIPFGLGWLVLLPVLIGSLYASYVEIFE